ncbi:MAG: hypothetical protein SVW02_04040, partial [Candidatus Nanohaloarchaea archaeon]|nr:hypothetical protein [Candidatus Nanohaloarchaea archaeon]
FLIDAVQNRELFARFPTQVNRMIGGTGDEEEHHHTVEVESGPDKKTVAAGALILGSFALLVQALPQDYMIPMGIIGLVIAGWILVR